jgi:hypothetical protein
MCQTVKEKRGERKRERVLGRGGDFLAKAFFFSSLVSACVCVLACVCVSPSCPQLDIEDDKDV